MSILLDRDGNDVTAEVVRQWIAKIEARLQAWPQDAKAAGIVPDKRFDLAPSQRYGALAFRIDVPDSAWKVLLAIERHFKGEGEKRHFDVELSYGVLKVAPRPEWPGWNDVAPYRCDDAA